MVRIVCARQLSPGSFLATRICGWAYAGVASVKRLPQQVRGSPTRTDYMFLVMSACTLKRVGVLPGSQSKSYPKPVAIHANYISHRSRVGHRCAATRPCSRPCFRCCRAVSSVCSSWTCHRQRTTSQRPHFVLIPRRSMFLMRVPVLHVVDRCSRGRSSLRRNLVFSFLGATSRIRLR